MLTLTFGKILCLFLFQVSLSSPQCKGTKKAHQNDELFLSLYSPGRLFKSHTETFPKVNTFCFGIIDEIRGGSLDDNLAFMHEIGSVAYL